MIKIFSAKYESDGSVGIDMTKEAVALAEKEDFFCVGAAFGDPFPGLNKRLRIKYEYDGMAYEDVVPEREMFVPRPFRIEGVPNDKDGFEIEAAKYGSDNFVDFTDLAKEHYVDPFKYCSIYNYKTDGRLGDPHPGVLKYYVIRFRYNGRTYISSMKEPNTRQKLLSPIFSVIIPTWNREHFLRRCVDSVLNQDFDPSRVEIIVVDDGSTDDTPKIMGEICKEHSRVAYVRIPHVGCCGLVRNYGVRISSGAYLAYLDSDDKFKPRHLSASYEKFQKSKALLLRTWSDFCTLKVGANGEIKENMEEDFKYKLYRRWAVYPSCIVHRRELLDVLGRLDPFVAREGEDVLFLGEVRKKETSLGIREEVVEEKTVTYGLIIGGNNLTYENPVIAALYRDREK